MMAATSNPLLIVGYGDREIACAKPQSFAELEQLCYKVFGIADDARLIATTTDLPASNGRSVEIHNDPTTWEAVMSGAVGRIVIVLVDDKVKVSINCVLPNSPPATQHFHIRPSQPILQVLGGACAAFGINRQTSRLVLLRLEKVTDGMVERKYICSQSSTVRDSGIQAGSRLLIEPDPDAVGQTDSDRWGGPGPAGPNDGHGRLNSAPADVR